jgi:hypothetical protein
MKINAYRCSFIVLGLLILGSFLALSPASAAEAPGSRCLPLQRDLTNPSIAGFLDHQILVPISSQRGVMLRSGQKVSSQTFAVAGLEKMAVTVTCTSTCTGNGCSINGCDASSFGCSSCSCWGIGCSACTCSKTSVYNGQ